MLQLRKTKKVFANFPRGFWRFPTKFQRFSSVNLFGEQKHKLMITNAHIILIAAGFMTSPSDDL